MKTLITVLILLANTTVIANQNHHLKKPNTNKLIQTLQLNSYQSEQLKVLMRQHRQEIQSSHQKNREHHEKMRTMHKNHRQQLLKILNYEQLYKFDDYMHQFRPYPHGFRDRSAK